MKNILIIMFTFLICGSCSNNEVIPLEKLVAINRKNIQELKKYQEKNKCHLNNEKCMTKKEILQFMGNIISREEQTEIKNPSRMESLLCEEDGYYSSDYKKGDKIEFLYFYDDIEERDGFISNSEVTPIVTINDRLHGIGWGYYPFSGNLKTQ